MRKRISAMLLAFAMVVTTILSPLQAEAAQDKVSGYEVIKPDNYDSSRTYPVVYIMPENGYKMDNSGMAEKFQAAMEDGTAADMILVKVAFDKDTDLHAAMENLVNEIDKNYNTIKNADGRAIVGTGVGGYLAYILGLTEKVVTTETVTTKEVAPVVKAAPVEETVTEEEAKEGEVQEEVAPVVEEVVEEEETDSEDITSEEIVEEVIAEEVAPVVAAAPVEKTVEKIEYKTLSKPNLFKYIASTRGDFVSEDNEWYSTYGKVAEIMAPLKSTTQSWGDFSWTVSPMSEWSMYLDAPVRDVYTDMEGSTNDLGKWIINDGVSSDAVEFTVRAGKFTEKFLTESVNRIAARITKQTTGSVVTGSVSLEESALTADVEKVKVNYELNVGNGINTYSGGKDTDLTYSIAIVDPDSGEVLTSVEKDVKVSAGTKIEEVVELDNKVDGALATVQLSVKFYDVEKVLATAPLARKMETVVDGDNQFIDLMGDWYFNFTGNKDGIDVKNLTADTYEKWSVVTPALNWWKPGFGNIVDEYFSIGDGYYVKTFDIPAEFDAEEIILSVGYMDDRGQAYINGQLVGETGLTNGVSTEKSTWAHFSAFEVDPSILNIGGTNTVVIRCQNDGLGGGGWYAGPVGLYSKAAFDSDERTASLFEEDSFDSKYVASAQGMEGTVENGFLIYLPAGYHTSDKHYPTVYLMHQFNSDHTSYRVDGIDEVIEEGIKQALIDEMIVVVPNSSEQSWWQGDWQKMITDELIPLIDKSYRTINDARYRFTAGCSMGGQGAMDVALTNPNYFSGAVSFFGAFDYAPVMALYGYKCTDPRTVAKNESEDYLNYYSWYFICGNQDDYKFGNGAIDLHKILAGRNIEHKFFIENGSHNTDFYLPYFLDAFTYTREQMYKSDEAVEKLMSGELVEKDGKLYASFEALAGIEKYFNNIPASSYTKEANPNLNIPLIVRITQNGETVYEDIIKENTVNAKMRAKAGVSEYELPDLSGVVDMDAEYTVTYSAAIFDRVVELDSKTFNSNNVENPGDGVPGEVDPEAGDSDVKVENEKEAVKTGDEAPVMMYSVIAVMALAVVVVAFKKRRG